MTTHCLASPTIVCEDERWNTFCSLEDRVQEAVEAALTYHGVYGRLQSTHDISAHVTIILANDAMVAELNHRWRGRTGPTNVLSFPIDIVYPPQLHLPRTLGDIVLAYETVLWESKEQGKDFQDHVTHLIVHGILHLVGYDHEIEDDAEEMEEHERRILAHLGIPDPYRALPLDYDSR